MGCHRFRTINNIREVINMDEKKDIREYLNLSIMNLTKQLKEVSDNLELLASEISKKNEPK